MLFSSSFTATLESAANNTSTCAGGKLGITVGLIAGTMVVSPDGGRVLCIALSVQLISTAAVEVAASAIGLVAGMVVFVGDRCSTVRNTPRKIAIITAAASPTQRHDF